MQAGAICQNERRIESGLTPESVARERDHGLSSSKRRKGQTMTTRTEEQDRADWVAWLESYGAAKFYDAFMSNAQGAESTCEHCGQPIYLDIREGGGVPDWGSSFRDGRSSARWSGLNQ